MYKIGLSGFGGGATVSGGAITSGGSGGGFIVVPPMRTAGPPLATRGPLPSRIGRTDTMDPLAYRSLRRVYRTAVLAGCSCED